MPISLNSNSSFYDRPPGANGHCVKVSGESLHIGLINNMPDAALQATERQFITVLEAASQGISLRLSLYSLPGVPRTRAAARHIGKFYSSIEDLWDTQLDGLIVTGREPLAATLPEEPYWPSFTRVLEWARTNTCSTVWSCLAAHAAILHMDGIGRVKSDRKHFGVFDCARVADHSLTAGLPERIRLPHSRWNGISERELTLSGYRVLTRSADVGVDTFIRQQGSLFVFFQGHPEYESNTLLLEFRRDVRRYLEGESDACPSAPRDYFDRDTEMELTAVLAETGIRPGARLVELYRLLDKVDAQNGWHSTAARLYRNWLDSIAARKQSRLRHGAQGVPSNQLAPVSAS